MIFLSYDSSLAISLAPKFTSFFIYARIDVISIFCCAVWNMNITRIRINGTFMLCNLPSVNNIHIILHLKCKNSHRVPQRQVHPSRSKHNFGARCLFSLVPFFIRVGIVFFLLIFMIMMDEMTCWWKWILIIIWNKTEATIGKHQRVCMY